MPGRIRVGRMRNIIGREINQLFVPGKKRWRTHVIDNYFAKEFSHEQRDKTKQNKNSIEFSSKQHNSKNNKCGYLKTSKDTKIGKE